MALSPSPICDSPPSPVATVDVSQGYDNNLQPFFVLHKALRKSGKTSSSSGRTRRCIDMPPSSPKSFVQGDNAAIYERLRLEAFDLTWSKIDFTVKEVLREINITLFEEIRRWVFEYFSTIRSTGPFEIMKPYPIATGSTCKRIPTALVFTKNIEFVDDLLTFQDLMVYMKANGCHVAYLSPLDFSIKHGIGICLNSLSRQLVSEPSDVVDVSLIASWYCESENYHKPIVVIINGMEQCDGAVLANFIKLISEWVMKIPIIFIMGVTTSFDAPRKLLPTSVLHNLQPFKFTLEPPGRRMDSLIEAVLVRSCCGFFIGHKVAVFLRNHFIRLDGTITSFLKAMKLACVKHFIGEPLSFLCPDILHEDCEGFWPAKFELLTEGLQNYASDLQSCQSGKPVEGNNLAQGLFKLKRLHKSWSAVVLCLFEVGKLCKIQLLDIFCEAIDPCLCSEKDLDQQLLPPLIASHKVDSKDFSVNGRLISQVIQKVRELSSESLSDLLNRWSLHVEEMIEIVKKMRDLRAMINLPHDGITLQQKNRLLGSSGVVRGTPSLNDEAAILLVCMVRKYLVPIESVPFHEIVCFKDVSALKSALIGDPRGVIQGDLLKSNEYLQNASCCVGENVFPPSTHDTAIMYNLAQEYDDLINLHDWYNSFKVKVMTPNTKAKRKVQHPPSLPASKKGKSASLDNEASRQARFCKAVTELQITGLVRMPSKRRPDFLQRIAFDL